MNKFELHEVDKDFYAKLQLRDIARLDIASSVGLETIAFGIVSSKTGLFKTEIERIAVTCGSQLCFAYDAETIEKVESLKGDKRWLDSYFSLSDSGNVVVWVEPDGIEKFYRIF